MLAHDRKHKQEDESALVVAVKALRKSGHYGEVPISIVEEEIHSLRENGLGDGQIVQFVETAIESGSLNMTTRRGQVAVFELPEKFQRQDWR